MLKVVLPFFPSSLVQNSKAVRVLCSSLGVLLLALCLNGCSQPGGADRNASSNSAGGPPPALTRGAATPTAAPQGTPTKVTIPAPAYRKVRGEIQLVSPPSGQYPALFAVAHENIPGFMTAMTMSVPVRNPQDAKRFKKSDKIRFDLVRHDGTYFVENVTLLPATTALNIVTF